MISRSPGQNSHLSLWSIFMRGKSSYSTVFPDPTTNAPGLSLVTPMAEASGRKFVNHPPATHAKQPSVSSLEAGRSPYPQTQTHTLGALQNSVPVPPSSFFRKQPVQGEGKSEWEPSVKQFKIAGLYENYPFRSILQFNWLGTSFQTSRHHVLATAVIHTQKKKWVGFQYFWYLHSNYAGWWIALGSLKQRVHRSLRLRMKTKVYPACVRAWWTRTKSSSLISDCELCRLSQIWIKECPALV